MNVRGERILIFGDSLSHVGPDAGPAIVDITNTVTSSPGGILARDLLMGGAQAVRVDAKVGRSAKSFWGAEGGASLITRDQAEFRPTIVIVWLGTNDIDRGLTPDALASTAAAMTQIRDVYRSSGAEVFALGPPSYTNARYNNAAPAMLDTIRGVFGADHTLDIRALTADASRTNDGIHFTAAGAKLVGPRLAQALTTQPSKLDTVAAAGMSTNTKIALGALGVVGFIGAAWFALRIAKSAAQRSGLGATDVKLIKRVAQLISYDVSKQDIREQLVAEGYDDDDVFQAYSAAKVYLRRREIPDSNYGRAVAFQFGRELLRFAVRRR